MRDESGELREKFFASNAVFLLFSDYISSYKYIQIPSEAIVQRIRKDEGMNWPYIIKDALEIVKQCTICHKFTIAKKGYNPLKPLYCYTPGYHHQVDLCGPFPVTSSNNTYILLLLDIATRFVVLRPISDKSAKTVAKELVSIFSLIGYPRILNSDRGAEWKNQILKFQGGSGTAYRRKGGGSRHQRASSGLRGGH